MKTASILLAIGAAMALLLCCSKSEPISQYRLIHKPGASCPSGWTLEHARFSEANGTMQDACINPNPNETAYDLDYLAPGERVSLP